MSAILLAKSRSGALACERAWQGDRILIAIPALVAPTGPDSEVKVEEVGGRRSGHYCTATACLSLVSGFVESQEGPRFFIKPVSLETGEIRVRLLVI